jgi:hypothetical protein
MDTLITVGIILAMSALGSIVIRRLHHRQAGRVAAMGYGHGQPGQEGRRTEGRRIRPVRVPPLRGRVRRDNRDGGRGRHPARRRRSRPQ